MPKTRLLAYALAALALAVPRLALAAGTTLNGSGSTLSKPYQESAIEDFKKSNKELTINYGGGGSGKGSSRITIIRPAPQTGHTRVGVTDDGLSRVAFVCSGDSGSGSAA